MEPIASALGMSTDEFRDWLYVSRDEEPAKVKQLLESKTAKKVESKTIVDLKKAIRANPKNDVVLRQLAVAYEAAGDLDNAIETMDKAYEIAPSSAALCDLVRIKETKLRANPIKTLHGPFPPMRDNPSNAKFQTKLQDFLNKVGRGKDFPRYLERLEFMYNLGEGFQPSNAEDWVIRAYPLMMDRLQIDAERILKAATDIEPQNPEIWYDLGIVFMIQNRHHECLDAMQKVLKFHPNHGLALTELARQHLELDDLDTARTEAEKALEVLPEHPTAWQILGDIHAHYGEFAEAEEAYKKSVKFGPTDDFMWQGLITFYINNKRIHRAEQTLRRGKEKVPALRKVELPEELYYENRFDYDEDDEDEDFDDDFDEEGGVEERFDEDGESDDYLE